VKQIEHRGSDSGEPVQFSYGIPDIEPDRSIAEKQDHSGGVVKIMSSFGLFIIGGDSAKDADNLPSFAMNLLRGGFARQAGLRRVAFSSGSGLFFRVVCHRTKRLPHATPSGLSFFPPCWWLKDLGA
jgi:hypothetical protein